MTDPDPAYEKKVLLDVVRQMKDVERTARQQATMKRVILGLGAAGLTAAFVLALGELVHPFAVPFVAGMGGMAAGFGLYLAFAHKQWPITRRHIDMESVRRRLQELQQP